jgi:hypothetical protein
MVPVQVGHSASLITALSSLAPFRIKAETIATREVEKASDAEVGFLVGVQATILPNTLQQPKR